ncbi:hypothetical protein [Evansella halocellulosilytica]|uniref:hypothetical protein n=1 Tax=Evansella halocellulosilytica TaxID=2011013 RepID=UPI000BB94554|nr:hypothetical protein [Evansella halocellulosilytica]
MKSRKQAKRELEFDVEFQGQIQNQKQKGFIFVGIMSVFFIIYSAVMFQLGLDIVEVVSSVIFLYIGTWFGASTVLNLRKRQWRWVLYLFCTVFILYRGWEVIREPLLI